MGVVINKQEFKKHFQLPFEPHDFQWEGVEEITARDASLLKYSVGLGKTACALVAALQYSLTDGVEKIIVLCPPILLDQWYEFILEVKGIPDVCLYRGTPAKRKAMTLDESIILASYNIFRGADNKKFENLGKEYLCCVIADELSLKDVRSKTYKLLKKFVYGKMRTGDGDEPLHKLIGLNATPLSDLSQVYNWCSMMVPGVYRNKRQFETIHVEKVDHWGKVLEWDNVELMEENFGLFTVDTDEEVKLPELVETVVPYTLSSKHLKLYREVEKGLLSDLPEDKIDLAINSMFSTLQRLVLVPKEFGLDLKSPVLDFIEGYRNQLGDDALLIYTRHVNVSKMLEEEIDGCRVIYGGTSKTNREEIFAGIKDGSLKTIGGNLDAMSHGLNLQDINHMIYAEMPFRWDKMVQSLGRTHRQGQRKACFANYCLAKDTLQYKIYYNILVNKQDISSVIKTKKDVTALLR
jgi:hypothetical protein